MTGMIFKILCLDFSYEFKILQPYIFHLNVKVSQSFDFMFCLEKSKTGSGPVGRIHETSTTIGAVVLVTQSIKKMRSWSFLMIKENILGTLECVYTIGRIKFTKEHTP